jgi:hypothetical protein
MFLRANKGYIRPIGAKLASTPPHLAYHLASAHFIVESAANARGDIDGHDRTEPSVLPDRVERPWRGIITERGSTLFSPYRAGFLPTIAPCLAAVAPILASFLAACAPVLAPIHSYSFSLGV